MAKSTKTSPTGYQSIYVIQSGPYRGQVLLLADGHANEAIADGWGIALSDALAPNEAPPWLNDEPAQSYLNWLNDAQSPGLAPVLASLSPASADVGSADVLLTATGSGFADGDIIVFNGGDEATDFVSATSLTTTVKPSLASGPIIVPVTVRGAGGTSNMQYFEFTEPPPPEQPEE